MKSASFLGVDDQQSGPDDHVTTLLTSDDLTEKLSFASRRLEDLLTLIRRDALGSEVHERQQLIQDFFFHLIGAIDLLAQLVNDRRNLGIDLEDVNITSVAKQLPAGDPLKAALLSLYVLTRHQPLPADSYSDEGYLFRAYNYRNQVTHRRRNPFTFRMGSAPSANFMLDPRNPAGGTSTRSVEEDLRSMLELVKNRCATALGFC